MKAVGYATKAKRHGRPKMVLLGDIVGESDDAVARAASEVIRIANARGAEGFVAVSGEARKRFWQDRARTAAIARHTNAFKINEDVVIPLERLGDYTDGIERINIELSLKNKLRALRRARRVSSPDRRSRTPGGRRPKRGPRRSRSTPRWTRRRRRSGAVRARWQDLVDRLDATFAVAAGPFGRRVVEGGAEGAAGGDPRRPRVRAGARALQCDPPHGAAQPGLRRAAHARRRRQRAHEPARQLRRLRDAAGGERRRRADHGARAAPGRRHLGRARDRHHQARIPDRGRARALRRATRRGSTPRAASTPASCWRARTSPGRTRRASR